MSEIPADLDIIASDIVRADYSKTDDDPEWIHYLAVARALLAERNRCLSILKSIEPMNPSEAHLIETIVRRIRGSV